MRDEALAVRSAPHVLGELVDDAGGGVDCVASDDPCREPRTVEHGVLGIPAVEVADANDGGMAAAREIVDPRQQQSAAAMLDGDDVAMRCRDHPAGVSLLVLILSLDAATDD